MGLISLTEGQVMINRYKENRNGILKDNVPVSILTLSETFLKSEIDTITGQNGYEKFRCYFGMDDSDNIRLIIVAVNDRDEDILGSELILEKGQRCPDDCPPLSDLTS